MSLLEKLVNDKAKEDNKIDLHSYALGVSDALSKGKHYEMLEFLKEIDNKYSINENITGSLKDFVIKARILIKDYLENY